MKRLLPQRMILEPTDGLRSPKKKAGSPKKTVGRPKKKKSGRTFARPVGRPPSGMAWDPVRGLYVATVCSQDNNEKAPASKDDRRTEDGLRSPKKKTDRTFSRPIGRPPSGMTWDPVRGLYVMTGSCSQAE